jgi:hypothetical protein
MIKVKMTSKILELQHEIGEMETALVQARTSANHLKACLRERTAGLIVIGLLLLGAIIHASNTAKDSSGYKRELEELRIELRK